MATLATDPSTQNLPSKTEPLDRKLLKIKAALSKAKAGLPEIDLSDCGLNQFPLELLGSPNIKHLILRGNSLETLPEDLFERLPSLEWLDVRDNRLSDLPHIPLVSATPQPPPATITSESSIGSSTAPASLLPLRNLLLARNHISSLPVELGFVPYLVGLNLDGNPLSYPPADIIRRGTQAVLRFLRNSLLSKTNSTATFTSFMSEQQQQPPSDTMSGVDFSTAHTSAASSETHKSHSYASGVSRTSGGGSRAYPLALHQMRGAGVGGGKPPSPILSVREPQPEPLLAQLAAQMGDEHEHEYMQVQMQLPATAGGAAEGTGMDGKPITRSAVLHAHLNTGQIRQIYMQRLKNAALVANNVTRLKPKPSEHRVNLFPPPPPVGRAEERARSEQADAARRRDLEDIDRKLQKVKNVEYVSDWKDKTKQMQRTRNAEQRRRPHDGIAAESKGRVKGAPFDIGDELAMQSNEERMQGRLLPHVVEKPRPMSPTALVQRDREQRVAEEEVKQRVEEHAEAVRKRVQRRKAAGTRADERGGEDLRTAQYDLEIAHRLRRELEARRRDLESHITEYKM